MYDHGEELEKGLKFVVSSRRIELDYRRHGPQAGTLYPE